MKKRGFMIALTVIAWIAWLIPLGANFFRVNAIYQVECLHTDLHIIWASGTMKIMATEDPDDQLEMYELAQVAEEGNIIYDGDHLGITYFPYSTRLKFWEWNWNSNAPGLLIATIPWIVLAIFPGWITFFAIRIIHRHK